MTDLRTRLAGDGKVQPGGIGRRVRRSDDLHVVAIAQLGAQRHQLVVDLDGDAMVADVGMHRVSEIHGSGAAWQGHDVAARREHIDLVRKQVDLDVFEKLGRILVVSLDVEQ